VEPNGITTVLHNASGSRRSSIIQRRVAQAGLILISGERRRL